jgi:flavin reductase (DIM6/NTAB) family NADH-FMN oxidoreductase RutF
MLQIGPYEVIGPTIEALSGDGLFLVSGHAGNPMTIGWATFGRVWGRPVAQVLVRPSRHSFSLLEELGEFTICVPGAEHKKALAICGSKSGRDVDKINECGFTRADSQDVRVPHIVECPWHYECRVIHVNDVINATLDSELISSSYPAGDLHRIYFGEIVAVFAHG